MLKIRKQYDVVDVLIIKTLKRYKRRGLFENKRTQNGQYGIHIVEKKNGE